MGSLTVESVESVESMESLALETIVAQLIELVVINVD